MIKLEKYTGIKTYMFPNGAIATPEEVKAQFPAVTTFTHVIETDPYGQVLFAVENLAALRGIHNIDPALSEDEAIAAIEVIINTPPEEVIGTEERIAAALEFQNLLSM